ncbi:hypothetical protein AB0958_27730 [Streptomyces sp. NPDC006655]|uniref:hypothetical protein n=1 Tax=Streptomyces sp. NPDC006655 TaxID=3156898 RepID=UPI003451E69D
MTDAALPLKAAGRRAGCHVSHPGLPARPAPRPYLHPVTTPAAASAGDDDSAARLRTGIGAVARRRFPCDVRAAFVPAATSQFRISAQ